LLHIQFTGKLEVKGGEIGREDPKRTEFVKTSKIMTVPLRVGI